MGAGGLGAPAPSGPPAPARAAARPTALEEAAREALAALGGSVSSAFVMYPLDLLKTRMQAGLPGQNTLWRAGRAIVKEDGLGGLYRGLRTDLLKCGVVNFVYFFAYVHLKRALKARRNAQQEIGAGDEPQTPGKGDSQAARSAAAKGSDVALGLAAGVVAGIVSQLFSNPINVTLTYIQTTDQKTRGFASTLARIIRAEGPGALYRGLGVGCILTLNPAIQYWVYDHLLDWVRRVAERKGDTQEYLEGGATATSPAGGLATPNGSVRPKGPPKARNLPAGQVFGISSVAKLVATLLTYPLILSKTRMQAEGGGAQRSLIGVLAKVFKEEGLEGLFTGFNVQATKSILGAALMMVVKEHIDDAAKDLADSLSKGGVHPVDPKHKRP
eukprot:PRCOL_00003593-RA